MAAIAGENAGERSSGKIGSHLAVILTNRCNLKCVYCLRKKNRNEIPLKILKKIVAEAHLLGYRDIGLTGGDPFLYTKFKDVIDFLGERGWNVLIETNGILLNIAWIKYLKAKIKSSLQFSVSLDSHIGSVHDAKRGKGAHYHAVRAIKMLVHNHVPVRVVSVMTEDGRWSKKTIRDFVNYCTELGVSSMSVQGHVSVEQGRNKLERAVHWKILEQASRENTGIGFSVQQIKHTLSCNRLENGSVAISAAGIHPCIFNEGVVIGGLHELTKVIKTVGPSFREFRNAAVADCLKTGYDCSKCISNTAALIKEMNVLASVQRKDINTK